MNGSIAIGIVTGLSCVAAFFMGRAFGHREEREREWACHACGASDFEDHARGCENDPTQDASGLSATSLCKHPIHEQISSLHAADAMLAGYSKGSSHAPLIRSLRDDLRRARHDLTSIVFLLGTREGHCHHVDDILLAVADILAESSKGKKEP
jgi:hypothetical protein